MSKHTVTVWAGQAKTHSHFDTRAEAEDFREMLLDAIKHTRTGGVHDINLNFIGSGETVTHLAHKIDAIAINSPKEPRA